MTVWTETTIRVEMKKLDAKTGLKGAELPISFNNAKCTLGLYCSENGGSFKFFKILIGQLSLHWM